MSRYKQKVQECHSTHLAVWQAGEKTNPDFTPGQARAVIHTWVFDHKHIIANYSDDIAVEPMIIDWLDDQCEGDFTIIPFKDGEEVQRIHFEMETDAVLFNLRFGGKLSKST